MEPLVVFNPAAHGGKARDNFESVRDPLKAIGARIVESAKSPANDDAAVAEALNAGCRFVIAAGGDGTVHAVVNALWRTGGGSIPDGVRFGAIGLGSSNDFHKPYDGEIPIRMNTENAALRDLVRVCYAAEDGTIQEAICVVSASLGVTAEANDFFDHEDRLLHWFKHGATSAAIAYSALRAIACFRNLPARMQLAGEDLEVEISSLSILKTPFLSGALRFDVPIAPDDGRVAVNLCAGMTRRELLATMLALYRGQFRGRAKTRSWLVDRLRVETVDPVAFEVDGEVTRTNAATFDVQPREIMTCGI